MMTIEAYYDNDDRIVTDFNGDYDDAIQHYLGKKHVFDYGTREEMATCERIFFHGNETDEIYMECAYVKDGEAWYEINRDTGYCLSDGMGVIWTVEKARKDYIENVYPDPVGAYLQEV